MTDKDGEDKFGIIQPSLWPGTHTIAGEGRPGDEMAGQEKTQQGQGPPRTIEWAMQCLE